MIIYAHRRAMARHTEHVQVATCVPIIRLAGGVAPHPGLHLELTFEDGRTQRVIFPAGDALDLLADVVRVAQAGVERE